MCTKNNLQRLTAQQPPKYHIHQSKCLPGVLVEKKNTSGVSFKQSKRKRWNIESCFVHRQ